MTRKRKQLFVDRSVQTALLIRVAMYWVYCLLAVALMVACWIVVSDRPASSGELAERVWHQCGMALAASLLVLPVVLMDCLRLSNRFTGPVMRVRRALRQLACGQPVEPVALRKGDFWIDFAEEFNSALARGNQPVLGKLTDPS